MAAMVKPRRASRETSRFDLRGAVVWLMFSFVGGLCSFVAVLNYKEKQNIKLLPMKRSLLLLIIPVFALSCSQMNQSDTTNDSKLGLSWSFQGNNTEEGSHSAAFVLENHGESALSDMGWALYYNQLGLGVID